jgi:transposase
MWKVLPVVIAATILKRHLIGKVQVSDLCDEYQLSLGLFQKKLMENAVVALAAGWSERTSKTRALEQKIEHLEEKLAHKDSMMAELLSEYVALRRELGGPDRPGQTRPGRAAAGSARELPDSQPPSGTE